MTAIGTLGAVILALLTIFIGAIRRHLNKPILEVTFENQEPYCRETQVTVALPVGHAKDRGYWLRLRVRNRGRSIARHCQGKLVSITEPVGDSRTDFDPIVLQWVTSNNPIDIGKEEFEYLDVLHSVKTRPDVFFIGANTSRPAEETGINLTPPRQDYLLRIVIYGENADPLHKTFYLKNDQMFNKIRMTERR
jgi:hypothetical protein